MSTMTAYQPRTLSGSVGPSFEFLTLAALWVAAQVRPWEWSVEQISI